MFALIPKAILIRFVGHKMFFRPVLVDLVGMQTTFSMPCQVKQQSFLLSEFANCTDFLYFGKMSKFFFME